jgi:hypothetical protein
VGVQLAGLDLLDGIGEWSIPAAIISGPGVLVLLWLALQALGAVLWVPAVRRMRGEDARRRPRRRI